ncbi:hypothetical protein LAZ67_16002265, partial [Cordylochernes scorpioides]
MVFRNSGKPSREDRWYWNGKPRMVTRIYNYLGYPLVSTTKTTQAANFFKGKAIAAINATTPHTILAKSKINSFKSAMKLFDSIVMAVLMYAASIWATEYKDLLDHIQDTFIRRFLNLPRYTPGYIIRPETGRVLLIITALKLTLKYWLRVLSMDTNRLPRICLNRMRQISCATEISLHLQHEIVEMLRGIDRRYFGSEDTLSSRALNLLMDWQRKDAMVVEFPIPRNEDDIGGLDKDDHILIRNYTPKYKNKSSVYIESKEIEETILKTNIKKAPGPDYISNNMIRQAKIKIIPILHKLFNKCIEMGYYPDEWKKSFLKIIPKPGKTNYEINKSYRPISLTSNLSKTFENIIKNKLSNYYLENNLMSSRQHGFMKSRSTITGMDKIIETILKHKQKELTSLIAIDIAGAFDNAWWPAIIKRMDNDDVPSDLIRIIKSYLNNEREVKFTYESETFYKKLTKGCPQGGPLSPLLWNILLNDLLINFDSMNADIICYADDVTIICWNKTIEGLKTASEYTLNYVIQWCNRNKLTISTEKTNMLYLHNRQKIPIK